MAIIGIAAFVLVLAGFGVLAFLLWRLSQRLKPQDNTGLLLLQSELNGLRGQLDRQLQGLQAQMGASQSALGDRLDKAALVFGGLQKSLGGLSEATGQIQRLGAAMGQELGKLQAVFQPPKLRGGIGEILLESLLGNILPPEAYALQHAFKRGDRVDALIRLPEGLVPVDAKFPLENFRRVIEESDEKARSAARREFERDVRKHVDDIARKYILPDEGTLELALMYIPAENVYYEAFLRGDGDHELYRYALEKRVFPVSPNSFYAYLSALVQGFRGLKIAEQAREIQSQLGRLHGDLARFAEDFALVGRHLGNASKVYGEAEKRLARFEDKLAGLKSGAALPEGEAAARLPNP